MYVYYMCVYTYIYIYICKTEAFSLIAAADQDLKQAGEDQEAFQVDVGKVRLAKESLVKALREIDTVVQGDCGGYCGGAARPSTAWAAATIAAPRCYYILDKYSMIYNM